MTADVSSRTGYANGAVGFPETTPMSNSPTCGFPVLRACVSHGCDTCPS